MEQQIRNIMIAFISLVSKYSAANPIVYPNIEGKPYTAIQTNEAAVVAVERMFPERPLSDLFCIVSKEVQDELAPVPVGQTPCTHQQFLERRLLQVYPSLKGHFHYFSYTDSIDDMDKNLLDVTKIARGILDYARQYPNDKVIVHADMTGGMRHVSMMMLSVMQMLKYSGIVIGEVLYSDPRQQRVYKATQIQRMFTLINGADEFVKFGSVNAIKEYFHNKEVSPQLQHLLDCMERFSQAIHLCQTNSMQPVLHQLREAIDEFQNCDKKDLQEQLFNGLLATIRREYGKLLTEDASMLDIIRWCLKNEFWQQALTLCTEWLPVYLVNHQIAYTDNEEIKAFCAEEGKAMVRDWKQDFIIACSKTKPKGQAPLYPAIADDTKMLVLSTGERAQKAWQQRQSVYRKMYRYGILQTKLSYLQMLTMLRKYNDIRSKRNEINHANADEKISLDELRSYIYVYLDQLASFA